MHFVSIEMSTEGEELGQKGTNPSLLPPLVMTCQLLS